MMFHGALKIRPAVEFMFMPVYKQIQRHPMENDGGLVQPAT
jgi:hypothetical protein